MKVKDKKIKDEFKELKAKAKEMSKAEMKGESLDEKRSSPYGEVMLDIDAASKQVNLPMAWMKDYVKEGFDILATLPEWYQYLLYIAISASFGIKGVGQAAKMFKKK